MDFIQPGIVDWNKRVKTQEKMSKREAQRYQEILANCNYAVLRQYTGRYKKCPAAGCGWVLFLGTTHDDFSPDNSSAHEHQHCHYYWGCQHRYWRCWRCYQCCCCCRRGDGRRRFHPSQATARLHGARS